MASLAPQANPPQPTQVPTQLAAPKRVYESQLLSQGSVYDFLKDN
jgi:hypothetical protein